MAGGDAHPVAAAPEDAAYEQKGFYEQVLSVTHVHVFKHGDIDKSRFVLQSQKDDCATALRRWPMGAQT